MSQVSSLSSTIDQTSQVSQTERKKTLTQEDFLNLFIRQMQYQNPLDPMDSYQMATQMAQFNMVEAINQMTQSMQNMEAYQASINSLQASALIGKKVEATGNTLSINQEGVTEGAYQLSKPGKVQIQIFDTNGNLVRAIDSGTKDTSKQQIVWDGKNQQGESLALGNYTFRVSAADEKNQPIEVKTFKIGTITGTTFEDGVIYLNLGSDRITISQITAILA